MMRRDQSGSTAHSARRVAGVGSWQLRICVVSLVVLLGPVSGCTALKTALGIGKYKGIERTGKDEKHWLVKDVCLTAGSSYLQKELFDHKMNESVNLFFTPANEKNHYVVKAVWIDPSGIEFHVDRKTYDIQAEGKSEVSPRKKGGTPRVHTMFTKQLFDHKPGVWKVALYIDDELARRLTFTIR